MHARFIVMTDTHFEPASQKDFIWWNRMLISKNQGIIDAIVETVTDLRPDFVVHCGDFTSDAALESFDFGKKNMDRLPCPYYIALGNHDTFKPDTRNYAAGLLENENGSFSYKRTFDGFNLVILDCAYWINPAGEYSEYMSRNEGYGNIGPPDPALQWLEGTCASGGDVPTILAMHTPIVAKSHYDAGSFPGGGATGDTEPPDRDILHDGATLQHLVDEIPNHRRLLEIIENNPQIKLVLTGHWHLHDIITRKFQVFCATGSMIEYPLEMRLVELSDKRIEISTVAIAGGRFAEASLIPKYRNEFTAGEDRDREYSLRW